MDTTGTELAQSRVRGLAGLAWPWDSSDGILMIMHFPLQETFGQ